MASRRRSVGTGADVYGDATATSGWLMHANTIHHQTQATSNASRNSAIELLRVAGAVGIVWFHMHGPGFWIGYAALPLFIQMTVFYGVGGASPLPPVVILRRRIARLMPIWLFWFAAFAALRVLDALLTGASALGWAQPWMWLTGASLHLWFLPFALLGTCIVGLWLAFSEKVSPVLEAGILAGLSLACLHANTLVGEGPPFPQWLFGLPSIFVAISFVRWRQNPENIALGIPWVVVFGAAVFLQGAEPYREFMLASLAFAVALQFGFGFSNSIISRFASFSLGVYLVHPAIVSVLERGHFFDDPASFPAIFSVIALSTILTGFLTQIPVVRRYV